MRIRLVASIPVLALATVASAGTQTTELSLGKPAATIAEPYSEIVGLAELRDGRVMVSDRIVRT